MSVLGASYSPRPRPPLAFCPNWPAAEGGYGTPRTQAAAGGFDRAPLATNVQAHVSALCGALAPIQNRQTLRNPPARCFAGMRMP